MADTNFVEKVWDLANVITGFSVAQNLAVVYGMGKGDFRNSMRSGGEHLAAAAGTIAFSVAYILAICWCGRTMAPALCFDLSPTAPGQLTDCTIWHEATCGRIWTVILFTLVMLATVSSHYMTRQKPA